MAKFAARFRLGPETRILDVGGSVPNWNLIDCKSQITILNLSVPSDTSSFPSNFSFVKGDATSLNYADDSFDVIFSNSVIEHLHTYENQVRFADEIVRVSRNVWVQTPARWFFVEPHLIMPLVHYLPKRCQRRLLRNFTIWGLVTRPTKKEVDEFLDEVHLLTYREMKLLFPDCHVRKEKFLFLTKSYIAVKISNEKK
jgi:hypothetical protein